MKLVILAKLNKGNNKAKNKIKTVIIAIAITGVCVTALTSPIFFR